MTHEQPKNRRRALFWLAPLIAAAVCAAAISLLFDRTRKREASPRVGAQDARLAALEEQLKRSNAALRRLEQVQLVQAASASERNGDAVPDTGQQAATNEPAGEPDTAEDAEQAPYPEEREKAFFSAYFSELEAAMSKQRPDRQAAAQLMQLVPGVDQGLVRVLDLRCTEQLCRLEAQYQHADRASRDRFVEDLQSAFAPVLNRASIHLPTDEKRLVGYFAKKGAPFPRPTTSFAAFMRGDEG